MFLVPGCLSFRCGCMWSDVLTEWLAYFIVFKIERENIIVLRLSKKKKIHAVAQTLSIVEIS